MVNKRSARGRHNVETDKAFFINFFFFAFFLFRRIQNKSIYHNLEINELLRKSNIFLFASENKKSIRGKFIKRMVGQLSGSRKEKRTTSTFYLLFTSPCYIRLVLCCCYLVLKMITFSCFLPFTKRMGLICESIPFYSPPSLVLTLMRKESAQQGAVLKE